MKTPAQPSDGLAPGVLCTKQFLLVFPLASLPRLGYTYIRNNIEEQFQ